MKKERAGREQTDSSWVRETNAQRGRHALSNPRARTVGRTVEAGFARLGLRVPNTKPKVPLGGDGGNKSLCRSGRVVFGVGGNPSPFGRRCGRHRTTPERPVPSCGSPSALWSQSWWCRRHQEESRLRLPGSCRNPSPFGSGGDQPSPGPGLRLASTGRLAKTDAIDALVLAQFAEVAETAGSDPLPTDPEQALLALMARRAPARRHDQARSGPDCPNPTLTCSQGLRSTSGGRKCVWSDPSTTTSNGSSSQVHFGEPRTSCCRSVPGVDPVPNPAPC